MWISLCKYDKKHYELYISDHNRELLELHSCGGRDKKASSTGGEPEEEAKHKEEFFVKRSAKFGNTYTPKKALIGNEDIDHIGMEYLSNAKSKWNVYGNFEWKDFGPDLKEKTDDAPLATNQSQSNFISNENENENKDSKEKEKEKEHLTENLNEIQYVEDMKQVIEMYENKNRQISIDLIPNLMYANEPFVDILMRSQVSRYVEFRGVVHNFVFFDDNKPSKVYNTFLCIELFWFHYPKEKYLTAKDLGMHEKRQLMKFMHGVLDDSSNPTNQMAIDLH
ncbi:rab proteins geranylgeranyltransferase component A 2-like protein [Reticulomyxa filosa]|uniref:Rab proteins geranylgeranyltransferase component A 2-like protein n=1 Tax=Reticulomyxa filosa TaxID=46433 RepID=X6LV05_RETFI|nr:rab proteins geranylgeranyltransferase component A 2-like protein [Reticulomyxa filosa]|eukprot:ETO05763.1 rab proteins geranylgeranyltransferase component A 2-like protein [Reticulomyxa filosa]